MNKQAAVNVVRTIRAMDPDEPVSVSMHPHGASRPQEGREGGWNVPRIAVWNGSRLERPSKRDHRGPLSLPSAACDTGR